LHSCETLALMTRALTIILTLLTLQSYGQVDSTQLFKQFASKIDSLKNTGELVKKNYEDMSYCGGSLSGFYKNDELVLIESYYGAEAGYGTIDAYLLNGKTVIIKRDEHFAEWDKYTELYPNGEGENGDSYEHMTYTDTTYFVILTAQPVFSKLSRGKLIDNKLNSNRIKKWLLCIESMIIELHGAPDEAEQFYTNKMRELQKD